MKRKYRIKTVIYPGEKFYVPQVAVPVKLFNIPIYYRWMYLANAGSGVEAFRHHHLLFNNQLMCMTLIKDYEETLAQTQNETAKMVTYTPVTLDPVTINVDTMTLYSEIEYLIIMWRNENKKTAGHLTRQIMQAIKKYDE
mgnify:CR=1 FL=1